MQVSPGWMSAEFVDRQRGRLEALRDQLVGLDAGFAREVRAFNEERDGEPLEYEDRAQESTREETRQGVHDLDKARLRSIARALEKIEQGTYGLSDASGKRIPKARLDAVPEATLRVDEMAKTEGAG